MYIYVSTDLGCVNLIWILLIISKNARLSNLVITLSKTQKNSGNTIMTGLSANASFVKNPKAQVCAQSCASMMLQGVYVVLLA